MEYIVLALMAVILTVVSWYRGTLRKREGDREQEARQALRRRIEQDPSNLAAFDMLGDNLRRSGFLEEARGVYADALSRIDPYNCDTGLPFQLKYKLTLVDKEIADRATLPQIIDRLIKPPPRKYEFVFCRSCGASNPSSGQKCETCGTILPADTIVQVFGLTIKDMGARRPLIDSILTIIVAIVVLRIFVSLPGDIRGLLTVSACIVAIYRLMWTK